jgi:hypothetical protein
VLELAADQRTQLGAVGTKVGAELVAAAEPDAQHKLLATSERNVRGPEDLPFLIDYRWQAGQDSVIGTVVSDLRYGSGKPEAELPEGMSGTVHRTRTPLAGLRDVQVAGRREREMSRVVQTRGHHVPFRLRRCVRRRAGYDQRNRSDGCRDSNTTTSSAHGTPPWAPRGSVVEAVPL